MSWIQRAFWTESMGQATWKLPLNMILRCDNKRWWHLLQLKMEFATIATTLANRNSHTKLRFVFSPACVYTCCCIICTVFFQLGNIIHRRQTLDNRISYLAPNDYNILFTTVSTPHHIQSIRSNKFLLR